MKHYWILSSRLLSAHVSAGVEDGGLLEAEHAALLVAGEVFVPRDDDGVHVADAAARRQDAAAVVT